MFRRFWRYLMALFNRRMDQWEDPEVLLDQARRDMQESHMRNRERAIQAITQKNNLQAMVDKEQQDIGRLNALAETALKRGDRELARKMLREKMTHEQTLTGLRQSLATASTTVDQVKVAIQREEENIRQKTAEALALKARWKQAQIQNSIQKALSGLQFEDTMGSFSAAEEKIRGMQSEADARTEMYGTSMAGKVAELQSQQVDMEAEEELVKMEQRLGLAKAPPTAETEGLQQISATSEQDAGDVDKELKDLEARLGTPPSTTEST